MATTRSPSDLAHVGARELARELVGPRGALAFDGDGTLWSGDVGEDFFYGILDSGKIHATAVTAIKAVAREHALGEEGSPAEIGRRIYDAYLRGAFDEERVCELMTWINAGWSVAETEAFVRDAIGAAFASRIHPEVKIVIDEARALGHEIFVVSASPLPIVVAGAAVIGVSRDHVLAAASVMDGDRFAAAVHRPIPYGPGKASALRARLGDLPLLAAFGDSAFDGEMLAMSRLPIAVRPKPRLIARAPEIPGLRVLAVGGTVD